MKNSKTAKIALSFIQNKTDVLIIAFFLFLSFFLFFYKLSQSSLVSWDEAWYGVVARNITLTGDFLNLTFNNRPFVEHPFGGFLLPAILFKIFGYSEFVARFQSAFSSLLAVIIVYLLGKELFNRVVGFSSALAFISSIWFVYRARSGNLDAILTLFFLLTLFLAIKATKEKRFFLAFSLSFAFLLTIKAYQPFFIIPSLIILFFNKHLKYKITDYFLPISLAALFFGGWLFTQSLNDSSLIWTHFKNGSRDIALEASYLNNFLTTKEYLHNGIGKWFWPGVLSIFGSPPVRNC